MNPQDVQAANLKTSVANFVPKLSTATPAPAAPPVTPPSVPPNTYQGPVNTSINGTQQGADLVNANQAQAAKMGVNIPGSTYQAPSTSTSTTSSPQTDTTATDTSTNGTDAQQKEIADNQAALDQANADFQAKGEQVSATIDNISNGATPLAAAEQAQVDGLKGQFQQLIDAQTLQNTGAAGTANIRGFQTGSAEYDPMFQVKTIGAIVTAGQQKIANLQTQEAAAIAQMTQGFHDNDIKAIQDSWQIYQDTYTARTKALQDTITNTQAAIKQANDAAQTQQNYNLDVAKFNQTGDQDSFDNALKAEQEKFAESEKTATDAETARHDQATEAISAFNAGMGAGGGGSGLLAGAQSAQLTPTGNPDPVSQAQVYNQISTQYGPMTAIAIKGLANYELNPSDWTTRIVKGGNGMTREQAVTLAKMYDPTYNDQQFSVRQTYMKNLASSQTGTVGSAINSANKAVNHLTAYLTEMGKIPNTPSSAINTIDNATFGNINPSVRQAKSAAATEGLGVSEELAKFFKGSGTVDVASIDAWKSQLSTNASPADQKGLAQGAITLLAGQLETLSEQYQNTMGKAPTNNLLSPSAMASLSSLKNQGYDVPIPGVLYTDKAAYIKNDPDAVTNMNIALKQITDAGIPATPENILQYAQSL